MNLNENDYEEWYLDTTCSCTRCHQLEPNLKRDPVKIAYQTEPVRKFIYDQLNR